MQDPPDDLDADRRDLADVQCVEPRSLKAWITSRTSSSLAP